jgi:hypothetical protein
VGEFHRHTLEDGNIPDDGSGRAGERVAAPGVRGVEGVLGPEGEAMEAEASKPKAAPRGEAAARVRVDRG